MKNQKKISAFAVNGVRDKESELLRRLRSDSVDVNSALKTQYTDAVKAFDKKVILKNKKNIGTIAEKIAQNFFDLKVIVIYDMNSLVDEMNNSIFIEPKKFIYHFEEADVASVLENKLRVAKLRLEVGHTSLDSVNAFAKACDCLLSDCEWTRYSSFLGMPYR